MGKIIYTNKYHRHTILTNDKVTGIEEGMKAVIRRLNLSKQVVGSSRVFLQKAP